MPVIRRIDPTPEQLQADLEQVYRLAFQSRFPDHEPPGPRIHLDKFQRTTAPPEGSFTQRVPLGFTQGELRFRFAWWSDPVGRRHWYIEGGLHDPGTPPGDALATKNWGPEPSLEAPPLSSIAPPLSFLRRGAAPQRQSVLVCRCGFAGTPQSLAWMGECCGPCFDREQEGLPPLGLPPSRPDLGTFDHFALAPDGRLVTVRWGEPDDTVVRAWAPPYTEGPIWQRRWRQDGGRGIACGRRYVAVLANLALMLIDLDDGRTCGSWPAVLTDGWASLAFAGVGGERLLALSEGRFEGWSVGDGGTIDSRLFQADVSGDPAALFISPLGQRALLPDLTLRDTATGRVLERLAFNERQLLGAAFAPDGAVFAEGGPALAHWPAEPSPPQPGLWRLLVGAPSRSPSLEVCPDRHMGKLATSPDGTALLSTWGENDQRPNSLSFTAPDTLRERARLSLPAGFIRQAAFSPDGHSLLVLTDEGLAVYPWRELLAAR